MVNFYIGLDLGQASDYTALIIVESIPDPGGKIYHVRRLERIRGEPYPKVAEKVKAIMASPALAGKTALVVDQTGVGRPVVDLLREAGLKPIAVSIHGGDAVSQDGPTWKVPKRDLVGVLQVLLQQQRFKVSDQLKLGPVLQTEMLNFKVKIDPITAHDSYSAWRDNEHDDLVLSAALACWWAETRPPKPHPFGLPLPRPEQLLTGRVPQPRIPKF
ncbi:MAG: hypothetical protein A4E49_00048 [Methanosaeta sp. PtaU1.Bin112]|jgi:hypothetical protein|nr:MAG: hypothetical protein A4E49_00048 [Methanosaeta sp. PtaU1.Bin112]